MTHKRSKYENLKTIESLLPSLSKEEKVDLFVKFVEASKSQPRITINKFAATSMKLTNGSDSLKRPLDTQTPESSLNTIGVKVQIVVFLSQY